MHEIAIYSNEKTKTEYFPFFIAIRARNSFRNFWFIHLSSKSAISIGKSKVNSNQASFNWMSYIVTLTIFGMLHSNSGSSGFFFCLSVRMRFIFGHISNIFFVLHQQKNDTIFTYIDLPFLNKNEKRHESIAIFGHRERPFRTKI